LAVSSCATHDRTAPKPPAPPTITVTPRSALVDVPVRTTVAGLPAGADTTVTASATGDHGTAWSATARFTATKNGSVSLTQPSAGGSYRGVDPMGLFDMMTPTSAASTETEFVIPPGGFTVTLRARIGGRVVAMTTVRRTTVGAVPITTTAERLSSTGIYGELAAPKHSTKRRPAILLFGGSEGGLATAFTAKLLAAHGYPALALAYFKEPGLPSDLTHIPLEYFKKALDLLRSQPGVDPAHIVVWGVSRGSEAALLLGVHYPDLVHGVVAGVPSSVVNPGYPESSQPAWTLAGKPIPAISMTAYGEPEPADRQAVIPVEKINGPVLLYCGGQDEVWHSCPYQDAITARLKSHHFHGKVTALRYSGAGHFVGSLTCYLSVAPRWFDRGGGTAAANLRAEADGHAALLRYLAALRQ
jgi:dienelactone hydrolase